MDGDMTILMVWEKRKRAKYWAGSRSDIECLHVNVDLFADRTTSLVQRETQNKVLVDVIMSI